MRRESLLTHALKQVRKNIKSYAMLSVTIVLSFSVFLGYLVWTDSSNYNAYKEVFSTPRQIVMAYSYGDKAEAFQSLISQVKASDPDCFAYTFPAVSGSLRQYEDVSYELSLLPANETMVFRECIETSGEILYAARIETISGKSFPLKTGEAVINESAFSSLFPGKDLPVEIAVPIPVENGSNRLTTLKIVGVISDLGVAPLSLNEQGKLSGIVQLYAPQSVLAGNNPPTGCKRTVLFCSNQPVIATSCCEQLGSVLDDPLVIHAVCTAQAEANRLLQKQAETKLVMALVLFLVLGVNLYGCFSNTLADRRFEIGVKRAIGAPARSIIAQFLLEGLTVTLANVLISVAFVTDLMIAYKLYQQLSLHTRWIVYLSPFSAAQFLVCSLSLTVLFSLLFACLSTRVEIVRYIKAE